MTFRNPVLSRLLAGLLVPLPGVAAEHEVAQENKQFTVEELTIAKGDTVHFPNHDPFFHNVFSLSEVEMFDLGSYPQGESKAITFETPGTVDVECAIHPNMRMQIHVQE